MLLSGRNPCHATRTPAEVLGTPLSCCHASAMGTRTGLRQTLGCLWSCGAVPLIIWAPLCPAPLIVQGTVRPCAAQQLCSFLSCGGLQNSSGHSLLSVTVLCVQSVSCSSLPRQPSPPSPALRELQALKSVQQLANVRLRNHVWPLVLAYSPRSV